MKNSISNQYFVIMYQEEIEQFKNANERLVYESIKSYSANGKKSVSLSLRDIAKRATLSKSLVSDIVKILVENKNISIVGKEKRRGGSVPVYKLSLPRTLDHKKRSEDGQFNNESVQDKQQSVHSSALENIQSNKVNTAASFSKEEAWEEFSPPYLKSLGISDPTFIQKARHSYIEKAKYGTQNSVHTFIDMQGQITPPDTADHVTDLWPKEEDNG